MFTLNQDFINIKLFLILSTKDAPRTLSFENFAVTNSVYQDIHSIYPYHLQVRWENKGEQNHN